MKKNKSLPRSYDWKDEVNVYYERAFALAIVLLLFIFIVFPKLEIEPYKHEVREIQTIELPPEVREEFKPPETVQPVIPLTIEEAEAGEGDEEIEEIETIGPTTLNLMQPPPPVRETGTTPRFRVYEEAPVAVRRIPPEYPTWARRMGIEGTVILQVEIFEDGTVGAVEVVQSLQSGPGGLDEAAINAVKQWRFAPAKSQGKPIAVWATIPIEFRLD